MVKRTTKRIESKGKYNHTCIKPSCLAQYKSDDVEPYYCPKCEVEKKEVAAAIDAKRPVSPKRAKKSSWQQLEEQGMNYTAPDGRKITFFRA